ncbi:MAG: hypothetical protein HN348_08520 [Proteobacteria bacterium]|nr:hypothetical protein [Pseudomonadota bacterium]
MTSVSWEKAGQRWSVQCGETAITVTRGMQELQMSFEECSILSRQLKPFSKRGAQGPPRAGLPWSEEDNGRLLALWEGQATVEVLATELERSEGAVRARLVGTQLVPSLEDLDEENVRRGGKSTTWRYYGRPHGQPN